MRPIPLYTLVVPIRYVPRWNVSDCMGETNFLDSKYPASLPGMTTTGDVVMASDAFLISEGEIGAPGVGLLPQPTRGRRHIGKKFRQFHLGHIGKSQVGHIGKK